MGQFKLFIQYLAKVYLPGFFLLILIFAAPFFLKFNNTSEKELHFAYYSEIEAYKWTKRINKIDGLILGSSTLRYGLSCDLLQSDQYRQWVNLSMDARDPVVFYLLLNNYINQIKPQIILVGLDPWIYSRVYYRYRNPLMLNDLDIKGKCKYFLNVDHQLPIRILKSSFTSSQIQIANDNYKIPTDFGSIQLNRQAVNFNEVNQDFFQISDYGWSQIQFDFLKEIDLLCKSKKIRVVYVISPKRSDYIKTCVTKFSKEHKNWWSLINKTIPDAEIIGRYDVLKKYNQSRIFAEAFHLNGYGQILFSKYIKNNILETSRVIPTYNFIQNSDGCVSKSIK